LWRQSHYFGLTKKKVLRSMDMTEKLTLKDLKQLHRIPPNFREVIYIIKKN